MHKHMQLHEYRVSQRTRPPCCGIAYPRDYGALRRADRQGKPADSGACSEPSGTCYTRISTITSAAQMYQVSQRRHRSVAGLHTLQCCRGHVALRVSGVGKHATLRLRYLLCYTRYTCSSSMQGGPLIPACERAAYSHGPREAPW